MNFLFRNFRRPGANRYRLQPILKKYWQINILPHFPKRKQRPHYPYADADRSKQAVGSNMIV